MVVVAVADERSMYMSDHIEEKYRRKLYEAVRFVGILSVLVLVAVAGEEWSEGKSFVSIIVSTIPLLLLVAALGLAGPLLLWWLARSHK